MEESTWLWIGKTIFYIALFFLLFILAKVIFTFRNRKIDIPHELTTKDNVAFSIMTTGYYIGVLIVFVGVIQGESNGLVSDSISVLSYGILGNILLMAASLFNEKVVFGSKLHLYREIIHDENKGTGFIEAANYIGSSLIIYGAITGKALNLFPELEKNGVFISGFISLIVFWLIGQLILFLCLKTYTRFSSYNVMSQIEKDNDAVGIVYASIFVSIAYLYAQAIAGDIISWQLTFENILYYFGLGVILLPVSRYVVDTIILPGSSFTHEIIGQKIPNQGAAIIEAFAYIGSAVLISYCI